MSALTKAWVTLLALSAGSTALAAFGLGPSRVGGVALILAVLALAGMKARVILSAYLGLRAAPAWQRGFDLGLALMLTLFAGLALAA